MKKTIYALAILAAMSTTPTFCASTAQQTLTMSISSASNITTTGNPGALAVTIDSSGAGSATDDSTSYSVFANSGVRGTLKITGAITSGGDMPDNTALTLSLSSGEGTSQGAQTLSTSSVDLVTKLPTLLADKGTITYAFNVTNGWSVPAQSLSRTVTLTLTSDS